MVVVLKTLNQRNHQQVICVARATPPPTGTGMWVGEGLSVGRLSGWVMTNSDGSANSDSIGCVVEAFLNSDQ